VKASAARAEVNPEAIAQTANNLAIFWFMFRKNCLLTLADLRNPRLCEYKQSTLCANEGLNPRAEGRNPKEGRKSEGRSRSQIKGEHAARIGCYGMIPNTNRQFANLVNRLGEAQR
jgi:hypothetical protein